VVRILRGQVEAVVESSLVVYPFVDVHDSIATPAATMADNNPNPGERLFKVNVGEACRQIVAGTFGGIACTVVGYPFDTLKVRMQMGASLSELLKTMSFRNLFAGIAAPIYSAMPIWAAGYSGYNLGKEIAAATSNTAAVSNSRVSPQEFFLGGFTSGVLVSLVRCPTDVVKVNCQNTGPRRLC